jgi:hypothetical protein
MRDARRAPEEQSASRAARLEALKLLGRTPCSTGVFPFGLRFRFLRLRRQSWIIQVQNRKIQRLDRQVLEPINPR